MGEYHELRAELPRHVRLPDCEQFTALAGTLATHYGRPGLRTHVLPFPLQTRPETEVRAIARDAFPVLLSRLGASV